ncbi:hypothetical protein RRG08_024696 [Elysia crispata]|uniref:Uncharacterized protein n=1 Tax=Elysia crispata TaxID=231223 RepID=A0AAE1CXI0_9GAST|nr:hypothetical protein RRG08_024696 [Elysia crispata]
MTGPQEIDVEMDRDTDEKNCHPRQSDTVSLSVNLFLRSGKGNTLTNLPQQNFVLKDPEPALVRGFSLQTTIAQWACFREEKDSQKNQHKKNLLDTKDVEAWEAWNGPVNNIYDSYHERRKLEVKAFFDAGEIAVVQSTKGSLVPASFEDKVTLVRVKGHLKIC